MKTARIALVALAALTLGTAVPVLPPAGAVHAAPAAKKVDMQVTSKGFVPARIVTRAGVPLILRITRRTDRTCAKEFVIKTLGIDQPLPLNRTVEVRFTPAKKGTLRYACGMDMIAGVIEVR